MTSRYRRNSILKKEPIRHHYVPQFILRNFCDNRGVVSYFDKKTKEIVLKHPRDIFMERNLYRDEINYVETPTQIESDLARFENEVAQLIRETFLVGNKIILQKEDDEKLKLFISIMSFRSHNTKEYFSGKFKHSESKEFYSYYQENEDFLDFWKRNLGYLVNCRSLNEVLAHEKIAEPIKAFMIRDTFGFFGMHFAVAEAREGQHFVLGDTYPAYVTGEVAEGGILPEGMDIHMYSINPVSPKRIILLVSSGAESSPRDVLGFRNCVLYKPQMDIEKNIITIRVKKLYPEEVEKINRHIIEASKIGYVV